MLHKILIIVGLTVILTACSEEQQNRLSRLGVTWLEGDYKITFVEGSHVKSWVLKDSKVTSDPEKGYYYFWIKTDKGSKYVQTPVVRTYIEEM